jgi:flagellar basal-body rod modification protein FlgD
MSVSSIAPTADTSAATTAAANAVTTLPINPKSALNQTDFLKLLVAQIQFQDPMNPQSDTQMAAQLAQFTSLQQATQSSASLAMMQANSLLGSTVTVQIDSTHPPVTGVVQGVVLNNGVPQITVKSTNTTTGATTTENYSLTQVTSVVPTPVTTTAGTTNSTAPTTP